MTARWTSHSPRARPSSRAGWQRAQWNGDLTAVQAFEPAVFCLDIHFTTRIDGSLAMHTPRSLVQNRCVLPNVRLKVERVCAFASIIPLFWKLGLALLTILPLAGTVRLAMVQSAESFFVVVGEAAGSRSPSRKAVFVPAVTDALLAALGLCKVFGISAKSTIGFWSRLVGILVDFAELLVFWPSLS